MKHRKEKQARPLVTCPDCGRKGRGAYWTKHHLCNGGTPVPVQTKES
jgi:hypothetical protein